MSVSFDKHDFEAGMTAWSAHARHLADNDQHAKPSNDLQRWMNYQNSCRKKNKSGKRTDLTPKREELLDSLHFPWKLSNGEKWDQRFEELVKFKEDHGHLKVPQEPGLGEWVRNQRKAMKNKKLDSKKVNKLKSIGFEWIVYDWDKMLEQLVVFAEENKKLSCPSQG